MKYIYFVKFAIEEINVTNYRSTFLTEVIELDYQIDSKTYIRFKNDFEKEEKNGKFYKRKKTVENISFLGMKNIKKYC